MVLAPASRPAKTTQTIACTSIFFPPSIIEQIQVADCKTAVVRYIFLVDTLTDIPNVTQYYTDGSGLISVCASRAVSDSVRSRALTSTQHTHVPTPGLATTCQLVCYGKICIPRYIAIAVQYTVYCKQNRIAYDFSPSRLTRTHTHRYLNALRKKTTTTSAMTQRAGSTLKYDHPSNRSLCSLINSPGAFVHSDLRILMVR